MSIPKKKSRIFGPRRRKWDNTSFNCKTIAVKKFPVPTTVKQVQSFLGLTGYFRKFIPAYSQIAKPLSDLTRKDNPFMFEQPQMEAFEKLKKLLTESPVLSIFQQGRTTELHTDASQQGYGAVLLQEAEDGKLHPVQYMSQKTTPAEEKYSSYELEVLAVVNALKKFRTYLLGNHFKIITDCSAFQKTMDKKDLVTRVARWTLLLEEYDYEIVHRSGQRMQHVDALSRYPVTIITSDTLTARLQRAQQEDENIQNLKYQHILTIIDAFTKFTWLYPVKSTTLEDALDKLKLQQKTFGNPKRIITDKGSPFNSKGFDDYCTEEKIQNLQITTGVPEERSSGENPPNSNPRFDQVVNRRSYKNGTNS
ncbi:retrovirus-related Pol polyprotein from transposon 17.6 [Trichonephila clavipes]|nr:retrovirus-related Pol polyprotein from transposon 17.6 [Trichonephila clavipes]